ncbi:hypothetical protein OROHE_000155 [Orobanche hederae]
MSFPALKNSWIALVGAEELVYDGDIIGNGFSVSIIEGYLFVERILSSTSRYVDRSFRNDDYRIVVLRFSIVLIVLGDGDPMLVIWILIGRIDLSLSACLLFLPRYSVIELVAVVKG